MQRNDLTYVLYVPIYQILRLFYASTGAPLTVLKISFQFSVFFLFFFSWVMPMTVFLKMSHTWNQTFELSVLHLSAWNVGFVLFNRPNPRLWEIVQQKAPMYCHGNLGGWRFEGESEYMLNEVKWACLVPSFIKPTPPQTFRERRGKAKKFLN